FTSSELFNDFIKKFSVINWNNICSLLTEVIKEKILIKLSKLSNEDKKFVESAINVANSSKSKEIYEYLSKYAYALKMLFPIWVSRPEQVSIFIPLERNYFEYGIYDEASQMFLERAYPLLYRSKINIIAGDDKQLKPSSFFISRNEENDEETEIDDLDIEESLLDRAKTTSWTEIMLQNHYRSENSDLIQFSSENIYDNKLNFASKNGLHFERGIDVVNCDGFFVDRINEKEALEVIKILEENVNKYKSILIITFNISQSSYIESLLMNEKYSTKEVMEKFMNQEIDVVNLENVQGNEADLVIISIAYAKKSPTEKLRSSFGPVIQSGGKNRLNVAITRSKNKMIILKSLSASEIANNTNENLQVFKKFIAFLDNIAMVNKANQVIKNENFIFDSSFEEEVFNELKPYVYQKNLKILTQFEVGNKKIDMVITNSNCEKVYLGIEVDGWKYHSGKIKVLEDFERQLFLESRGYPIFRVLEYEWKRNK
ncbi:MAG: hypothetical protein K2K18_02980, partial [Malacoplasma sp.]|nr:hypothetical protein [Malacoplasma sp.]